MYNNSEFFTISDLVIFGIGVIVGWALATFFRPSDKPQTELGPVTYSSVEVGDIQEQIADLLARGQKIEAIKRYREYTGLGLKEAKDAVEAMARSDMLDRPKPKREPVERLSDHQIAGQVELLLRSGRKIEAIKLYREHTGLGLKEAKDWVEALESNL
jgi:ribosomal protein L7/L12